MSQDFFPSVPFPNGDGLEPPVDLPPQDFTADQIPEQLQDDALVKYFRYRYDERAKLLASITEKEKERVERELKRIDDLRQTFFNTQDNFENVNGFERLRVVWKNHAIDESRKNINIRERVARMKKIKSSHRPKREQLERNILEKVRKWEKLPPPPIRTIPEEEHAEDDTPTSKPARGFFSNMFQRHKEKPSTKAKIPDINTEADGPVQEDIKQRARPADSYGISVSKITLKKCGGDSSSYMSYKIDRYPLNKVLFEEEGNPLRKVNSASDLDTISYFHIPANNMNWIEEAIARYYGEDSGGEYNYRKHPHYREKSSNILCREYWTSLQHGGKYDPVHARHMRAQCSLIVPNAECNTQSPEPKKNFVLFMPYLHWETHRRRKKMAEVTKAITLKHDGNRSHSTEILTDEFKRIVEEQLKIARAMTDAAPQEDTTAEKDESSKKRGPLGQYLIQIAKIYEDMDVEPDVRMLRDHLHETPPLHSRRTLDQSYYWKLANTDKRDEDQVVYRATKEGKNIARTTRVVMVDQLWLYILDENTIISSFPRRWGRNKPDYSGVHKGIRSILDHPREGQIQSVYDLALLIINQCSTVFFDRTKPVDERPELLDIFSNALSDISGMKTVAFETFWRHLDKLSEADRQYQNFENVARKYLNINPEGKLLKEVHDIIEELRMMTRIYNQQQTVVNGFKDQLETLHEQNRKKALKMQADATQLNVLVEIKNLLGEQFRRGDSMQATGPPSTPDGNPFSPTFRLNNEVHSPITENTLLHAKRVADSIGLRRSELQELEGSTVSIYEQLKDLLSLKQQQASIVEAKHALKRADESVLQGRSVMLFTIVTIIFLPLSFMTSVFGMNASDFDSADGNGNSMTLRHQFKLLFPISFGVTFISLSLALSSWIRSVLFFALSITWAVITEYTGLRALFKMVVKKHDPDKVWATQNEVTRMIYERKLLAKVTEILDAREVEKKEFGTSSMNLRPSRDSGRPGSGDSDSTGCFGRFKGHNDSHV